jgi:hypothetical protein
VRAACAIPWTPPPAPQAGARPLGGTSRGQADAPAAGLCPGVRASCGSPHEPVAPEAAMENPSEGLDAVAAAGAACARLAAAGLRSGLIRPRGDRPVRNGRWYFLGSAPPPVVTRCGAGDLSLADLRAAGRALGAEWAFVVLPEDPFERPDEPPRLSRTRGRRDLRRDSMASSGSSITTTSATGPGPSTSPPATATRGPAASSARPRSGSPRSRPPSSGTGWPGRRAECAAETTRANNPIADLPTLRTLGCRPLRRRSRPPHLCTV